MEEVRRVLLELKNGGLSILLVEQNLPLALRVADVVFVLSKGQVVFEGPPAVLREDREVLGRYLAVEPPPA